MKFCIVGYIRSYAVIDIRNHAPLQWLASEQMKSVEYVAIAFLYFFKAGCQGFDDVTVPSPIF